jgi:hypothetical protein
MDSGFIRDIGESTICVVAVECIADRNTAIVQIAPIDHINVLPAVRVKVGNAGPRAKLFAVNRDAIVALKMNKRDPRRSREILEFNGRWWNHLGTSQSVERCGKNAHNEPHHRCVEFAAKARRSKQSLSP